MTDLSARLQRYNASAPAGEVLRETLTLTHSAFSQDWHLTNFQSPFSANVGGVAVDFLLHPFTFRRPEDSTSGRFEVQADIFNTGPVFIDQLQAAAAVATERIQLIYGAYLDAGTDPEETFTLEVSGAAPGSNAVTVKAVIANMLNGKYPRDFYRSDKFPGLRR
ncbi:DUF1833 domain-containing protein [Thalassovita mediterranea]|nr:DUF1833 domain-containing protein [Thalassovita mediterranea]